MEMIIVKTTKMCFQVQYLFIFWCQTFVKDETIIQGENYVALAKLKPLWSTWPKRPNGKRHDTKLYEIFKCNTQALSSFGKIEGWCFWKVLIFILIHITL
jgi:hypothetical protein